MARQRHEHGSVAVWIAILIVALAGGIAFGLMARADQDVGGSDEQGPSSTYRDIAGVVERVDSELGLLRVTHEEIPGFMAAMTMDLQVTDPSVLQRLGPGEAILFDMVAMDGSYYAARIRSTSPAAGGNAEHADDGADTTPSLDRGDLVPSVELLRADGSRMQLDALPHDQVVVTFFYARCPHAQFCPAQARELAELQERLPEDGGRHLLSISLDPEYDTPEVLQRYAAAVGADPQRWTLANATDAEAVRRFADAVGARIRVDESGTIDHALIAVRLQGARIVDRAYGLDGITTMVGGW